MTRTNGIFTRRVVAFLGAAIFGTSLQAFAGGGYCGFVPMDPQTQQSADLGYVDAQGQLIHPSPDDVQDLLKTQGADWVSKLNPIDDNRANQTLWRNSSLTTRQIWQDTPPQPLNSQNYTLGVPANPTVTYVSDVLSIVNQYVALVSLTNSFGQTQTYNMVVTKNVHNYILRKALLEKLGYRVTPVQYFANLSVAFAGTFGDKTAFIDSLSTNLLTSHPERWITNLKDTSATVLKLQDVILVPSNLSFYDLASVIVDSIPQDRRLFNSLVVPFSLANVPESVNLFPWVAGTVSDNQLVLPCPAEDEFSANFLDSVWMTRRLGQLTRSDFQEVVNVAHYPTEVGLLMLEKLIARRNSLMNLHQLPIPSLPVNLKISSPNSNLLQEGRLADHDWTDHGELFAGTDPENPISAQQIKDFLASRLESSVLQSALTYVNTQFRSNVQSLIANRQTQLFNDQINNFLTTGNMVPTSKAYQSFSTHALIGYLSREIVIGSYLGSDSLVQVADSIGLGFQIGRDGYFSGLTLPVLAGGHFTVNRIYTHLRPLAKISAALDMPFQNLLVPNLKSNFAKIIDPILNLPQNQDDLTPDQMKILSQAITDLDNEMLDGESFVITDTVSADISVQAQPVVPSPWGIQVSIGDTQFLIRRIQILKAANHKIQIYFDPASMNDIGAALSLLAYNIPIISLSYDHLQGGVNTKFYTLDLATDTQSNSAAVKNWLAFRQILLSNSTGNAQSLTKPYLIDHDFSQGNFNASLLFYSYSHLSNQDHIKITAPDNTSTRDIYYRSTGSRTGKDYQDLVINILKGYELHQTGNTNFTIDATSSGNPADTFFGSSNTSNVTVQGEKDPSSGRAYVDQIFVDISHLQRGWNISKADAVELINEFNQTYAIDLQAAEWLSDAKNIELYGLGLDVKIYNLGINYLASLTPAVFTQYLSTYGEFPYENQGESEITGQSKKDLILDRVTRDFTNFVKAYRAGNAEDATSAAATLFDQLDIFLPGRKLINLMGGEKNVYIQAHISGFRTNDQSGDTPLVLPSLGVAGSAQPNGPLDAIRSELNISGGELFVYWFLKQL